MKKYLKIILVIAFISILSFFAYEIITKINHKKEVAENIKTIPKFSYGNIKGGNFTYQNLKNDTPTLFVYFNTECEYCNEEAEMIKENADKFKKVQLIFISFEKPDLIKTFATKHQLSHYDNILFLYDNKVSFATTFDVKSLPYLVLYDKNQKLIEKIKGQTKTEILLKKLTTE
jgi:thiol-disulfide isomerase/thioredoxin